MVGMLEEGCPRYIGELGTSPSKAWWFWKRLSCFEVYGGSYLLPADLGLGGIRVVLARPHIPLT